MAGLKHGHFHTPERRKFHRSANAPNSLLRSRLFAGHTDVAGAPRSGVLSGDYAPPRSAAGRRYGSGACSSPAIAGRVRRVRRPASTAGQPEHSEAESLADIQ